MVKLKRIYEPTTATPLKRHRKPEFASSAIILTHSVYLKGQCPDYAHALASSVFSSKDNRTVIMTRQDFLPDRTADGDLLFIFSSKTLDFQRNLSPYLKSGSRHEHLSRFYRQLGRLATRKSLSARFKNRFSNVKLMPEVNCSKSSNICLICSRSSLKRWNDINKNAISTL